MIVTFLFLLSGGMMAVLATADVSTIAWKYLRTVGAIALALSAGSAIWVVRTGGAPIGGLLGPAGFLPALGAAALVFLAPIVDRSAIGFRLLTGLAGLLGVAVGCAHGLALRDALAASTVPAVLIVASLALGGLLLGSINVAWLLGHAYLTQTRMTIAPLRHFSHVLLVAVGLRIVFAGVSLLLGMGLFGDGGLTGRLAGSWLMLSLRAGVGLVLVAVFSVMVWQCVRLRATQSATGILYFEMIFVCIGELASQELISELGWPI